MAGVVGADGEFQFATLLDSDVASDGAATAEGGAAVHRERCVDVAEAAGDEQFTLVDRDGAIVGVGAPESERAGSFFDQIPGTG